MKESEDEGGHNLVDLILLGVHVEVRGQLGDQSFSFYSLGPED